MSVPLSSLLSETESRPALNRAVRSLIERLGWHPGQAVGDSDLYLELSISYLAAVAEVSLGTAHTAWHAVRGAVGWRSVSVHEIRDRGLALRDRGPGKRWGQHLILARSVREVCRGLTEPRSGSPEFEAEWRFVEAASKRAVRCPWHDDRRPSAIWNLDPGGRSACLVCMVCQDAAGRPLVALAEQTDSGRWRARLSKRTLGAPISDAGSSVRAIETIQGTTGTHSVDGAGMDSDHGLSVEPPTRTVADLPRSVRRGEIVLGRLSGFGLARRSSARDDLLAVLRSADSRSGDSDWGSALVAAESDRPTDSHPDRLVSVQRLRPVEWNRSGRFARVSRWRPIEQRWILIDLDGLSAPLFERSDIDAFEARVSALAEGDSWTDGSFAVVRTSGSGVQVWMRLVCSVDPERFSASAVAHSWRVGLGESLADEIESLGLGRPVVDRSAFGSHRYGRRPGWRVKDGRAERASLLGWKEVA